MIPFVTTGFSWDKFLILLLIGVILFILSIVLYPYLIRWLVRRHYIGYDIHKTTRPATAESGGIGIALGLIVGLIPVGWLFPILWEEVIIFMITVVVCGVVGWYDDRKRLSAFKKIFLMFLTGMPLFIANLPVIGFISIDSPTLPLLGRLRLNIIYPLMLPFIIMIMTNTVNMLEGYNGEGAGTTGIATLFLTIGAVMVQSTQGLAFGIIVLATIGAFYVFNRFPAKLFPGDVGTLSMGAAVALVGIMGSIEVLMVVVMLPHIFNSFYVIASEHGFKESGTINVKDIWIDESDIIHASEDPRAALTLPRLILVSGPLSEQRLVRHFKALSAIAGFLALIVAQWILPASIVNLQRSVLIILIAGVAIVILLGLFPRLFGLTILMISLLIIGLFLVAFISRVILSNPINWLFSGLLAIGVLILWYAITLYFFRKELYHVSSDSPAGPVIMQNQPPM